LVFNYIQVAVKGHEHSPSPITMFSGLDAEQVEILKSVMYLSCFNFLYD